MTTAPSSDEVPPLTVVVASLQAASTVAACLAGLTSQAERAGAEIVVVDASTDDSACIVQMDFPDVLLLRPPPPRLIPELWAEGVRQARGEIVALTTAHFVPADDWIARLLEAHRTSAAGIGGAIEQHASGSLTDWAVYFCRYSRFMLPFPDEADPEPAGDNAAYKRTALGRYGSIWNDGFWEPDVHAAMRADGLDLCRTPAAVVYHLRSFHAPAFLRNRFLHGRQFGRSRAFALSVGMRLIHVMRAPLVPAVLLGRAAGEVFRKKRNRGRFLLALPWMALFYSAWTIGEVAGYLASMRLPGRLR